MSKEGAVFLLGQACHSSYWSHFQLHDLHIRRKSNVNLVEAFHSYDVLGSFVEKTFKKKNPCSRKGGRGAGTCY